MTDPATVLRELHFGPEPLVLPNAWDVETARLVEAAGFPVVATSSSALAASRGEADADAMDPNLVFDAVARMARSVSVPVSADVEAGYGLAPEELAARLVEAGAVGCNLEDTDHHGPGDLVRIDTQQERIAAVCGAARLLGVDLVLNARVDVFLRGGLTGDERVAEALRRGRAYLAAGATCVYPIGAIGARDVAALVEGMGGPVNIWLRPDTPSIGELARLGVARISLARGLQRVSTTGLQHALSALARGDSSWLEVATAPPPA